jgi:hypothetical protein
MNDNDADDDKVGYGKPPKHTRFRKGQSGNPKGRPKGMRNFTKDLEDVLKSKVRISEDGCSKAVSSQMAALMRLREKALNGDGRALDRMLALAAEHSAEKEARSAERQLSASEEDILNRYKEDWLRSANKSGNPAGGEDPGNGE